MAPASPAVVESRQSLLDRIAELEYLLGVSRQVPARLPGLRPQCYRLLVALVRRPFMTREAVREVLLLDDAVEMSDRYCNCHLSYLRVWLRGHGVAIINVWGKGWYLTRDDRLKVAQKIGIALPQFRRAADIVVAGRPVSEATRDELLGFVENLNFQIATMAEELRRANGGEA